MVTLLTLSLNWMVKFLDPTSDTMVPRIRAVKGRDKVNCTVRKKVTNRRNTCFIRVFSKTMHIMAQARFIGKNLMK